jgi:hypothetical protein
VAGELNKAPLCHLFGNDCISTRETSNSTIWIFDFTVIDAPFGHNRSQYGKEKTTQGIH